MELHGSLERGPQLPFFLVPSARAANSPERLEEANPGFKQPVAAEEINPDGDADLTDETGSGLPPVLPCTVCGGILKPDVVFFGENVPPQRVEHSPLQTGPREAASLWSPGLLTDGDVRAPVRPPDARGREPVLIINRDPTRGDELATYKLEVGCTEFLTELVGPARLGIAG